MAAIGSAGRMASIASQSCKQLGKTPASARQFCGRCVSTDAADSTAMHSGHMATALKPLPGARKALVAQADRVAKIQENLANQAKLIKEYQKQKPAKPPRQGLLQYIKKNAWEKE